MAVFNLSALADRVRYLETRGMNRQEAERIAFGERGLERLDENANKEYQRYYNNEHSQTELNKEQGVVGDRERLIDRNQAGSYETYDTNPIAPQQTATSTADTTAGQQTTGNGKEKRNNNKE